MYDTALNFLRAVLPSVPRYVGAVPRPTGGFQHTFFPTVEALAHHQIQFDTRGRTTYFALASFGADDDHRTAVNAHTLRSFWIDIDVGPDKAASGKGYATQDLALDALDAFIDRGFPDCSIIVSSGRGLHIYWVLDADCPKTAWQPVADAFQAAFQGVGLLADPVSADAARVLRTPGTHNRKDGGCLPVEVVEQTGAVYSLADIAAAASRLAPQRPTMRMDLAAGVADLECNADLLGGLPQRQAWLSAIAGKCKQVRDIASAQGSQCSEPLWYASVQLARHLVDGRAAAHYLSQGHPGYSPDDVDRKLEQLEAKNIGPTTCKKFAQLNPAGCQGCKWELTSPIQLGEKAPEPVKPVIKVTAAVATPEGEIELVETEVAPPVDLPAGFMVTAGGTVAEVFDDKGIPSWKLIFPGQIFPTRIFRAPGRPLELEVYSRREQTGEVAKFVIPATALGEAKETRKTLMGHIMIDANNAAHLQKLLNRMGLSIQERERTGVSVRQLGWQMGTDSPDSFVSGRTRFRGTTIERGIAIDESVEQTADYLSAPGGTIEGAREGAALFAKPGAQMHQSIYLTGLAGVFAPFVGAQNFAALSIVNRIGGEGKTTNCDAAMSHWFRPLPARSLTRDTMNALVHTMSVRGTLPMFIDEVTNAKPEFVVDLIYTASQGREKARMQQSGAKAREMLPPWKCPLLTTSNMSVRQLVRAIRGDAAALDARVIEVRYARLDLEAAERNRIGRVFYDNHGLTGPLVAQHVAANMSAYAQSADVIREKLVAALGVDSADRFWLNWGVGVLLACRATNHLQLTSYSLNELFHYVVQLLIAQRAAKEADSRTAVDILAEYLAEQSGRILVGYRVPGAAENIQRMATMFSQSQTAPVVGRTQLDEHVLYLAPSALQTFCTTRGYDFRAVVQDFDEIGLRAKTFVVGRSSEGHDIRSSDVPERYSLARGTPLAAAPSKVLALSLDHPALRGHRDDAAQAVQGPNTRLVYSNG